MRVTLKPGAWVEPARMMQAIRDAGFTPVPENIRITATGRLQARDGHFVLALDGMKATKELACLPGGPGGVSETVLRERSGQAVEIRGRFLDKDQGTLEVEAIAGVGQEDGGVK